MMDGLSEKMLIKDYHSCYPVHDDLEMLRQAYPDMYPFKPRIFFETKLVNNFRRIMRKYLENVSLVAAAVNADHEVPSLIPDRVRCYYWGFPFLFWLVK